MPNFFDDYARGAEFKRDRDQRKALPDLIARARAGDQEAVNQLIASNPDALKNSFELPGLGDISTANRETAKSQTMIAEATQNRGRLIKLKSNIAASLKGGPENLRTNVLKLASSKMDENDPDFNLEEVVDGLVRLAAVVSLRKRVMSSFFFSIFFARSRAICSLLFFPSFCLSFDNSYNLFILEHSWRGRYFFLEGGLGKGRSLVSPACAVDSWHHV